LSSACTPDEAVAGREVRRAFGRARRAERIVQRAKLRARRDAELGVELAHEVAVGGARARGLSVLREPAEVQPERRLVERVDLEQRRGQRDAFVRVETRVEALERRAAPRVAQAAALVAQPSCPCLARVVVVPGQQFAARSATASARRSSRIACSNAATSVSTPRRSAPPSASMGGSRFDDCSRNSALRRLVDASRSGWSGHSSAAISARATQSA
jgi:hypothetical protein